LSIALSKFLQFSTESAALKKNKIILIVCFSLFLLKLFTFSITIFSLSLSISIPGVSIILIIFSLSSFSPCAIYSEILNLKIHHHLFLKQAIFLALD
jgi:hypothetical protein